MSNNIFHLLQFQIKSQKFTLQFIASKMGCSRNHIYKMIRSPNISAVNLQKLSEILSYNFFNHLYSDANHPTPEQWHALQSQYTKLECENKKLTRDIQIYRETNEILTSQLTQLSKANINPNPPPPTE